MTSDSTRTQREFHLKSRPQGVPSVENFELVETELPPFNEGEFLVQNEWLSVDPYMRGRMRGGKSYVEPFELGAPMEGGCVGRVIESKNPKYSVGDYVLGNQGWRKYWISNGKGAQRIDPDASDIQNYLSVLGMTGMTAYVGLLKIGRLKEGETVFVSAASGAVGSIVCQIAKLKKCRVIGSAGSAAKIKWLKEKAGVDQAFNYHDVEDLSAKLEELCPEGIDVYFDNVGGDHLQAAIDNMKTFGRIVCCGMISVYNDAQPTPGPNNLFKIIGKQLRVEGFIVRDHYDVYREFQQHMSQWIQQKQIVWEETITDGLENAPSAFINLFGGDKLGKALVRV
ncbi:MAG: NADP-dependent oxidoreductase [Pirellulaceae bacterium]